MLQCTEFHPMVNLCSILSLQSGAADCHDDAVPEKDFYDLQYPAAGSFPLFSDMASSKCRLHQILLLKITITFE